MAAAGTGHARRGTAGFTLLEVLIAVAILSLALTSLLRSQIQALRATQYAREVSAAAFLAEYQIIEIEYELKQEGGWGQNDRTFEGDFSELGHDGITYKCFVDMIELPTYEQMRQAAEAAGSGGLGGGLGGSDDSGVQDAQDQAFDSLGMVWPILKNAVEQAIRKVDCKVYWGELDKGSSEKEIEEGCCEIVVNTFWTDVSQLDAIAQAGGEVDEGDDTEDDGGGGAGPGDGPGGRGGDGGGGGRQRGGVRGGGPVTPGGARGR